jgi:hypothetical protein
MLGVYCRISTINFACARPEDRQGICVVLYCRRVQRARARVAVAQMDDAGAPTPPPPPPPRRDTAARGGGAAHSNGNGARLKPFGAGAVCRALDEAPHPRGRAWSNHHGGCRTQRWEGMPLSLPAFWGCDLAPWVLHACCQFGWAARRHLCAGVVVRAVHAS